MITKQDLDAAIMECNGMQKPNSKTCIMLAAFYTIRDHLYPDKNDTADPEPVMPRLEEGYSYAANNNIIYEGDSDFAQAINGRDQIEILAIIDELMETLRVINPRLYMSVMRRIN